MTEADERGHLERWKHDRRELGALRAAIQRMRDGLGVVEISAWVDEANAQLENLASAVAPVSSLDRRVRVWEFHQFAELAMPSSDRLISVITATRDRATLLRRAIDSVLRQHHQRWELLAVDDRSVDNTHDVVRAYADPRIKLLAGDGAGPSAARNVALEHAGGSVIAYLDDDNVMHPHWLASLAWAFDRDDELETLYGARIIDDTVAAHGDGTGGLPILQFLPFDRVALERYNLIDVNVFAHRAGLDGATFDQALHQLSDWDLVLRLTQERAPLELPTVACIYTTGAPNRLSRAGTEHDREVEHVRAKLKAAPPAPAPSPDSP